MDMFEELEVLADDEKMKPLGVDNFEILDDLTAIRPQEREEEFHPLARSYLLRLRTQQQLEVARVVGSGLDEQHPAYRTRTGRRRGEGRMHGTDPGNFLIRRIIQWAALVRTSATCKPCATGERGGRQAADQLAPIDGGLSRCLHRRPGSGSRWRRA